jgi:hypothetical protein
MPRPRRIVAQLRSAGWTAATAIVAALCLGGCGLGAGAGSGHASVLVTQNFGSQRIGSYSERRVSGSETAMSLLQRHFHVRTRYGGGFVQSINGHSGGSGRRDWFYFVNGLLAPKGAAETSVKSGESVWWDLHDWSATDTVSAVVGSYPAPFSQGFGGKRYPTLLECANSASTACDLVGRSLNAIGVKFAEQSLGGEAGEDSMTIVVGTWRQISGTIAAGLISAGPAHSGIYGRFVGAGGAAVELDDPAGQVVRTLRGSVGMVAATNQPSLTAGAWLVTGTDAAGVNAAARALTPGKLARHFAVVVSGAHVTPIPLEPGR